MKESCKTTVSRGLVSGPCGRAAALAGYCKQHHPDEVAKRNAAARARRAEAAARKAAAIRARKLTELAERLIPWIRDETFYTTVYWVSDAGCQDTLRELYEMRKVDA